MTEAMVAASLFDYLKIIGTAMLPVLELKAAILAYGLTMNISIWTVFVLALIGSAIPVPFILLFIETVIHKMQKSKVLLFRGFSDWLMGKVEKHQDKIGKYAYWALFIFVAIPLPGTGVWTGSLLAAMLNLRVKKSFIVIILGNVVAGFAILLITLGIDRLVR